MTPEPPINESITDGYRPTGFGWFGRRARKAAASRTATATAPPVPARAASLPRPKVDPEAIPSAMAWDESEPIPTVPPGAAVPLGRPAPFAHEVPDYPRPQVMTDPEADGTASNGRPAPFAHEIPPQPRPRIGPAEPGEARPRPRSGARPGVPAPIGPAPVIPATLPEPVLEPEPAHAVRPTPLDRREPVATPPEAAIDSPRMPPVPSAELLPLPSAPGAVPEPLPLPPAPVEPPAAGSVDAPLEPLPGVPLAPPLEPLPSMPNESLPATPPLGPLPPEASVPMTPAPIVATDEAVAIPPTPVGAALPTLAATDALAAGASPVDPGLVRTSGDPTALRIEPNQSKQGQPPQVEKNLPLASARAAAVGDEVITVRQVELMVIEKYKSLTQGQQVPEEERREILNTLGTMALDRLIEQCLILQEAKRRMKNPKMMVQFNDFIDKRWRDEKLPELLRKHHATNEYELRRKLTEVGQSYPEMLETYRREMLEHDFLYNEVKNKINLDLVSLKAYYNDHIQEFDQPARLSWREIEVDVARYPDRAAARRQADTIRARLKTEDFAAVATATSQGPTASLGGLYADMTPGSYAIQPVNAMLGTIPERTISPVIEAPESFHIIRVETRRAAGPLRFDEVQKKVSDAVFEEGFNRAREQYLARLRARTLVRVMPMFEKAKELQERRAREDDQIQPASHR